MRRNEKIIAAVLTMLIGVLLMVIKEDFIGILMTIGGVGLVILGAVDIYNGATPSAVIKIVSGVLITVCGWVLVEAVLYVASALLLIFGILLLYDMIKKKRRYCGRLKNFLAYAMPVGLLLMGLLLLFHQVITVKVALIICGCLTLFEGGVLLVNAFEEE